MYQLIHGIRAFQGVGRRGQAWGVGADGKGVGWGGLGAAESGGG
jgi:hypothetical protein